MDIVYGINLTELRESKRTKCRAKTITTLVTSTLPVF